MDSWPEQEPRGPPQVHQSHSRPGLAKGHYWTWNVWSADMAGWRGRRSWCTLLHVPLSYAALLGIQLEVKAVASYVSFVAERWGPIWQTGFALPQVVLFKTETIEWAKEGIVLSSFRRRWLLDSQLWHFKALEAQFRGCESDIANQVCKDDLHQAYLQVTDKSTSSPLCPDDEEVGVSPEQGARHTKVCRPTAHLDPCSTWTSQRSLVKVRRQDESVDHPWIDGLWPV